jgi:hypothetical protein
MVPVSLVRMFVIYSNVTITEFLKMHILFERFQNNLVPSRIFCTRIVCTTALVAVYSVDVVYVYERIVPHTIYSSSVKLPNLITNALCAHFQHGGLRCWFCRDKCL